ncbi:serpin-Z2B-like [Papaver somniferum]|uniref:serpin-Z2B-like n=1 Tax=Papaver somniferum TaxID=3469 RepID=UPI000E70563E|nr:serpin-Z2B-like [Papaver somniferum]
MRGMRLKVNTPSFKTRGSPSSTSVKESKPSKDSIKANNSCTEELQLSFVGGVLVDKSTPLKPSFKEVANGIFKAKAKTVDFKNNSGKVLKRVNRRVKKETNGLIQDILPNGVVDEHTKVILVNALYFKGLWKHNQFEPSLTKKSKFFLLDGNNSVEIPFMSSTKNYQYISCFDNFKVLRLPYQSRTQETDFTFKLSNPYVYMYIILPDQLDGLGELEGHSSLQNIILITAHSRRTPPFANLSLTIATIYY